MLVLTLTFLIGPHPLNLRASHTLSGWNEFCYQDQMIHGHIERLNTFPHFSLKISAFQSDNIAAPFPVLSVGKKIHYQHSSKGPLCPTVPGTPLANDLWIHTLKSTPTFTPGQNDPCAADTRCPVPVPGIPVALRQGGLSHTVNSSHKQG